jgi:hypothetical protein
VSVLDRHEFAEGDAGEVNGFAWRVRKGDKSAGDLVLEMSTATGWRIVPMHLLALQVDFYCQNEPRIRPGYRAEKVIEHCRRAHRDGYLTANAILNSEKALARIEPPKLFDWEAEGGFAA